MTAPIRVTALSKRFNLRHRNAPTTLKEAVTRRLRHLKTVEQFQALDQVDLEVHRGEMVGIIGRNGAGKSTLLRLIGGVGLPDSGQIIVDGKIGALLELGAGFHPELTGRENILINGVVSGLTRREVEARFVDIVSFSELENFIDNPLRTYSSGMQLRLAFSISVHTDPEILLIDEVLSVGDLAFQRKCLDRIAYFRRQGCAILMVSHDIEQITRFCDRVIWLRNGRIEASGDPQTVSQRYEQAMLLETEKRRAADSKDDLIGEASLPTDPIVQGSGEVRISEVQIQDEDGNPVREIRRRDTLSVTLHCTVNKPVQSPIFSVSISDADGKVLLDSNTSGLEMPDFAHVGAIRAYIETHNLPSGDYFLDVGVYEKDWGCVYDYQWHGYPLRIVDDQVERRQQRSPHWEILSGSGDKP